MAASRDYERHLATLGVDVHALTLDSSGTLAAANEPKAAQASFHGGDALEIGRVLGEGGMGVVHVAVQRNLGREVAVKKLPSGASGVRARALISEAVVTGQLEHPNVVPIHSLTSDAEGRPALVMKLVRGSLWSDYLAEPERLTRDHPGDALEFHVGVLMTLCNAVEFAHSRAILHRDIKPTNVMIGRFGEIYLLDWGLAAAIDDDAPAALPRVSEICEPAGSPAYMAPEMAAADAELIGVRSDVYLLGAALHEVLTSRPPHQGASLLETLRSAFRADPPKLGDDVPRELAEICQRALAFDPMDRFASAGDLRVALSRYLSHRAARVLGTEADRSAEAYQRALDRNDNDADRLGTEARFAYQLALREWPDNVDAQQGLQRLLRLMVRAEISHGHVDAARHYLAELDARDEALEAELRELEERQERERRRVHALEKLRDDVDLAVTGKERLRRLIFIGSGTVLFVVTLTGLRLAGLFTLTPAWLPKKPRRRRRAASFGGGDSGHLDGRRRG